MTRHFEVIDADGASSFVSISGSQPSPAVPEGGRVLMLASAPTFGEPEQSLDMLRISAKTQIDRQAEQARGRVLTAGSGQAIVYERKRAEAADQLAGKPGPFPLLQAEVGITGADVPSVAVVVAELSRQWTLIAAAIESVRLGAKAAVDAAEDAEAVEAVLAGLAWPV